MTSDFPAATILGYPRIGPRRELKKALESYWAGSSSAEELHAVSRHLRLTTYERLAALGLDRTNSAIPASFSLYDQVLDAAVTFGAVPGRFQDLYDDAGQLGLDAYFTLARGDATRQPLEMTKWFDTNYHYLVPEIGPDTRFSLASDAATRQVAEAAAHGVVVRPTVIGPVTFLLLSKAADEAPASFSPLSRLDDLLPLYATFLGQLRQAGAQWIQLEEPALVVDQHVPREQLAQAAETAYRYLSAVADRPALLVTSQYGSLGPLLPVLCATGVEAVHVDLVKGDLPDPGELAALEVTTTLVAGVVDGHNVWKADLAASAALLSTLGESGLRLAVATSTSLQHVPHDVGDEPQLDPGLRSWLAFADQKVVEVVTLSRLVDGSEPGSIAAATTDEAISHASSVRAARAAASGVARPEVRERLAGLTPSDFTRVSYPERVAAQGAALHLPMLPTTTIGSFPQTADVRKARARLLRGDLSEEQYTQEMQAEIARVIALQEDLGFDVLVHGEPERNDMVQYFAEHLDGFAVTVNGWVQSYGSRCTRPSILWGDVSRPQPITVQWAGYAQSLTSKPVKGMLTGPVTILAWSFVRDDQPLGETANQVALALRDEVADLEAAGIRVVQVDEPALRELLPLRVADQQEYLDWSVNAFRLATAGAAPSTQIHTHLCYSEFGAVMSAIDGLDADVTSIEAARSRMEVVADLREQGFARGVGPGVYDIHSPRVPDEDEVVDLLEKAARQVPAGQLWVNPDCGLKTRGYDETTASLRNLVAAAARVRATVIA